MNARTNSTSPTTDARSAKSLPFATRNRRESGVLLHVTSLPGPYGVGDLGPAAHAWIDHLAAAHQSWWQMLPLGPAGEGHSPYQCFSAFAGNPLLISPDALAADGLLPRDTLPTLAGGTHVRYPAAGRLKSKLLKQAWQTQRRGGPAEFRRAFEVFTATTPWLHDYALFMALRSTAGPSWSAWPSALKRREPGARSDANAKLADAIDYEKFVQFVFARQLAALRRHARARGVGLIGDVPIFVSYESADVWTRPHLFQLDRHLRPKAVAGVPPDIFSATGQRWNNPLYDWPAMAADGYAWWTGRMRAALDQADAVRLDHFRGFDAYWRIPAASPTAENGRWTDGPGGALFAAMKAALGPLPLIAEDLGVITPRVTALRESLGLPGMRVIQFGFGSLTDSIHLPHRIPADCVAYSGTHDNDTTVGWFATLTDRERRRFADYAASPDAARDPAGAMIRLAWSSPAALAIAPLQDVLRLPSPARMNRPGVGPGNWRWRLPDFDAIMANLEALGRTTVTYGRA